MLTKAITSANHAVCTWAPSNTDTAPKVAAPPAPPPEPEPEEEEPPADPNAPGLLDSLKDAFKDRRFVSVLFLFAGSQMSFTVMTSAAAFIAVARSATVLR